MLCSLSLSLAYQRQAENDAGFLNQKTEDPVIETSCVALIILVSVNHFIFDEHNFCLVRNSHRYHSSEVQSLYPVNIVAQFNHVTDSSLPKIHSGVFKF
jgi:hypothetical protein